MIYVQENLDLYYCFLEWISTFLCCIELYGLMYGIAISVTQCHSHCDSTIHDAFLEMVTPSLSKLTNV